jgi:hypothetical protein
MIRRLVLEYGFPSAGFPMRWLVQSIRQIIMHPLARVRRGWGGFDPVRVVLAALDDPDENPHNLSPHFVVSGECFLRESVVLIRRKAFSLEVQFSTALVAGRQFMPLLERFIQVLRAYEAGIEKALAHAERTTGTALIRLDLADGCTDDHSRVSPRDSFYAFARQKRFPAVGLLPDPYSLGDLANQVEFPHYASEAEAFEDYRKRKPVIFWRGATTGRQLSRRVEHNVRARFCIDSLQYPEAIDAKISSVVQCASNVSAFRTLRAAGVMAPEVAETAFAGFQATVDLDGNASAWGGLRKHLRLLHVIRPAGPNEMLHHLFQPAGSFTAVAGLQDLLHRVGQNPRLADNFEVAWRGYLFARDMQRKIAAGDATIFPGSATGTESMPSPGAVS